MGENTKIEWATHSFNPWLGCTKIGPGCDNCYAAAWARRFNLAPWGARAKRHRTSPANWQMPIRWDRAAALAGSRPRVFCASLADVFDNAAPDNWRTALWELIRCTPHLDWLMVTKRIANAALMLPPDWGDGYPHVTIMATITSQNEADRDIPRLLALPAHRRGLSCEPLLGPVDLGCVPRPAPWPVPPDDIANGIDPLRHQPGPHLDWVIVGGESGRRARPMNPDWPRSLRDQCLKAKIPFFFKQWGRWIPTTQDNDCLDGQRHSDYPVATNNNGNC